MPARLKVAHIQHLAQRVEAEAKRLEPLAKDIAPLVEVADPALAARVQAAEAAKAKATREPSA